MQPMDGSGVSGSDHVRVDTASRVVRASPQAVYRALLDRDSVAAWLPPKGMTAAVHEFDPREGGAFRFVLTFEQAHHATPGKASEHSDVVTGRYLSLIPSERVVQLIEFESNDPAFAGEMSMCWSLTEVTGGTEVTITAENVPEGITPEDHDAGMRSTLENLAAFTEA